MTNVIGNRPLRQEVVWLFGLVTVLAMLPFVGLAFLLDAVIQEALTAVRHIGRALNGLWSPPGPNSMSR